MFNSLSNITPRSFMCSSLSNCVLGLVQSRYDYRQASAKRSHAGFVFTQ